MSRRIKIMDSKYINVFKMYGPALNPIPVSDVDLRKILVEGHTVYEKDACGTVIALNLENYLDSERFEKARRALKPSTFETINTYGAKSNIESEAKTFTGYTSQTAHVTPPIVNGPSTNKLSNKQIKELRRKQEAEERAKAKENQQPVVEVATETEESVDPAQE